MGSDFLFAQPSLLSGVGRTLDLAGGYDEFNVSATAEEADARAIRADWLAVGEDLQQALERLLSELRSEREDPD